MRCHINYTNLTIFLLVFIDICIRRFINQGADPDEEDIFGNTVLHMVVVTNQMVRTIGNRKSVQFF